MDGVDEQNCDKVEMNECDKDEYRCINGLCIPGEYWLDGTVEIDMFPNPKMQSNNTKSD